MPGVPPISGVWVLVWDGTWRVQQVSAWVAEYLDVLRMRQPCIFGEDCDDEPSLAAPDDPLRDQTYDAQGDHHDRELDLADYEPDF